jgi:hypothetical protein
VWRKHRSGSRNASGSPSAIYQRWKWTISTADSLAAPSGIQYEASTRTVAFRDATDTTGPELVSGAHRSRCCAGSANHTAELVPSRNERKPAYTHDIQAKLRLFQSSATTQDRLASDALIGSECRGSFSERQHRPHHRFEAPIPYPRGEAGQAGLIGFDNEEKCTPVARQGQRRLGDGDERSAGADQRRRTGENISADHVEHHVDFPGILQPFGLQVEEGINTELSLPASIPGAAGTDDARTDLASELHRDGPNPRYRESEPFVQS